MVLLRTPLQEGGFKAELTGPYMESQEFMEMGHLEKYTSTPAECLAVSILFMNTMVWSTTYTDNSLLEPGEHLSDQD